LPGTNDLAYYKNSQITAVKSFITLALEHFDDGQVSPMGGNYQVIKAKLDERLEARANNFLIVYE
jgi:hypothetical protein